MKLICTPIHTEVFTSKKGDLYQRVFLLDRRGIIHVGVTRPDRLFYPDRAVTIYVFKNDEPDRYSDEKVIFPRAD